jgi:pyruvate/2-oxoglutarate dehydrogenase complex dihydrolipoamide acyltransferase (E2) component
MDNERKPFDPNEHLLNLKGKPYLPVMWRLVWLREDAPESRIVTEMISRTGDEAVFKCEVTRIQDGAVTGSATGWGTETREDFGDFTEKAETKSIGRALAALGYGAEHDEGFDSSGPAQFAPQRPQNRQQASAPNRPANAPQRPPQNPTAASPNDPANANQLAAIDNLAKRKGIDAEQVEKNAIAAGFSKPWTNASAQAIIKALQEEPNR